MRKIPGLEEITTSMTPTTHSGLLGICLSGAGPTILALATHNFDAIAGDARQIFMKHGIEVEFNVLSICHGATVEHIH